MKKVEKSIIEIAKYNISMLVHTVPNSLNEKKILKNLCLSSFSRKTALSILLEILNVKAMIEKKKERERKWKK